MTRKKQEADPIKDGMEKEIGTETAAAGGALPGNENASAGAAGENQSDDIGAFNSEIDQLRASLARQEAEAKEHYSRLQYMAAEFDNFRRRTAKEKERLFLDATVEVVSAFLPVLDNLERAAAACPAGETCAPETKTLADGIGLLTRQFQEVVTKLGVTEIATVGQPFDPAMHNAVMHIDDDALGENEVVECFQKGYQYKDGTVVRHSMVKVAN